MTTTHHGTGKHPDHLRWLTHTDWTWVNQALARLRTRKDSPMTGPEFAQAHGNDSGTWSSADIEAQQNLAACDTLPDFTLVMGLGTAHWPIPTTPAA